MAKYSSTSPYFNTSENKISLDFLNPRTITADQDDISYTIDRIYAYRPDLLAYDLYKESGLWWVFYQRNPNTLTAPPWDFEAGRSIYLPKITTLQTILGF